MRSFLIYLLIFPQLVFATSNLLVNGGFEDIGHSPAIGNYGSVDTWQVYQSIPGWHAQQNLEIWKNNFITQPFEGSQVLELNAHPANKHGRFKIYQSFQTQPGEVYELTFYAKRRLAYDKEAFLVSVGHLHRVIKDHVTDRWQEYKFQFTAHSHWCTLSFASFDGGRDTTGNILDKVSVHLAHPFNTTPIAEDDTASGPEDSIITIDVLKNDEDLDGDTLSISPVFGPANNGVATLTNENKVAYIPNTNFYGEDSFEYTLDDGQGGQDFALVTVTVHPVNDAPEALDDLGVIVNQDSSVLINVLANDSDVDGDSLNIVSANNGTSGITEVTEEGFIFYTPESGFSGMDTFTYTIEDLFDGFDAAMVFVHVDVVEPPNLDQDGDGIPDEVEGSEDPDGDTLPNYLDLDSDNDSIPDRIEGIRFSDDDNIPDRLDIDSDNDSVNDANEAQADVFFDMDGDGEIDDFSDLDNNGLHDEISPDLAFEDLLDTDEDGLPDYRDSVDNTPDPDNDPNRGVDSDTPGTGDGSGAEAIETAVSGGGGGIQWAIMLFMALFVMARAGSVAAQAPDASNSVLNYDKDLQAHFESYFYGGLGLGFSHLDPESVSNGFSTTEEGDVGAQLFLGQRILPHWSWEVSYLFAGEAELTNSNNSSEKAFIDYEIPAFFAQYHLKPPEEGVIDVFGKVGVSKIDTETTSNNIVFDEESGAQLALGVGVNWIFNQDWFGRLTFERYARDAQYVGLAVGYQPSFTGASNKNRVAGASGILSTAGKDNIPAPAIGVYKAEVCADMQGRLDRVNFKVDSAELTLGSSQVLDAIAIELMEYSFLKFRIEAHTDSDADEDYNHRLSYLRAEAVAWYLSQAGVDESRLKSVGYGETKPIASNLTQAGRAKNRRVEMVISNPEVCRGSFTAS